MSCFEVGDTVVVNTVADSRLWDALSRTLPDMNAQYIVTGICKNGGNLVALKDGDHSKEISAFPGFGFASYCFELAKKRKSERDVHIIRYTKG